MTSSRFAPKLTNVAQYRVKDILEKTADHLRGREFVDNPRFEAELLLAHILKLNRIDLYLKFDQPLQDIELSQMRELLKRRASGEPMAYLLGYRGFYKDDFIVTEHTLVPRPETELLVEKAAEIISQMPQDTALSLCDLGTGSGAIGLSLAAEFEHLNVHLVDVSPEALEVAKKNTTKMGLESRVTVKCCEVGAETQMGQKFNLIVGNPPYIAENDTSVEPWVREYEPAVALFSANGGLHCLQAWAKMATLNLLPGGWLMLEHGYQQGEYLEGVLKELGYKNIQKIYDLSKHWRHTFAQYGEGV